MTSIKDVAKHAGVSVTTVSRAMNNTSYVSAATRKKINDAIATLDYHPDQIAIALCKKQSFIIGIIVPDSSNPFFAELIKFIEVTAQQKGYKILLCNSLDDKEKEQTYLSMLKSNRVDGIIMASHLLNTEDYNTLNRPVISFDRMLTDSIPYIASDNYTGGQLATTHLIEQGCKHLLHLSGTHLLSSLANARCDAFKTLCEAHNIPFDILEYQHGHLNFDYFYNYIEEVVSPYLANVDGVFCSNDLLAYALYIYCTKHHIKVPQDLKIVGYDYAEFTRILQTPKLTTIAQPIAELGTLLCESLISVIESKDSSTLSNQILPISLIHGETT